MSQSLWIHSHTIFLSLFYKLSHLMALVKIAEIPTIIRFNPTSGLHSRDADIVRCKREERDTSNRSKVTWKRSSPLAVKSALKSDFCLP